MKARWHFFLFCAIILVNSLAVSQTIEWAQHFNSGVQKVKADLYTEAAKEFENCISLDKNQTEAYKNLAYCHVKIENYAAAIKAYQDLLAVNPNDVSVMKALASLLLKTQKYALSYDILKQLILFAPNDPEPLTNLGLVCDYLGKNDEALETYLKALQLQPGANNIAFNVGRLYFIKGEYETSISYFKSVLDRSPQDYEAAINIANAYMSLGEREYKRINTLKDQGYSDENSIREANKAVYSYYERALPHLLIAAKSKRPTFAILNNLGITLKNLGRAKESNRVLELALAAKNNQPIDTAFLASIPLQSKEPLFVQQGGPQTMALGNTPPLLTSEVKFSEPSLNNALDAEETGNILIKIKNIGKGPASFAHVEIEAEKENGYLLYDRQRQLTTIVSGDSVEVSIPITAGIEIATALIKLKVKVLEEQFGNDADPYNLTFETRALKPPKLALAEFGIDDDSDGESMGNDNGRIEKGEAIELIALIRNTGIGQAEDVVVQVNPPGGSFFYFQGSKSFDLGNIDPGASKKINFAFSTGKRFDKNTIEFGLAIMERRSRFNVINNMIIPLEEKQNLVRNLVVEGAEEVLSQTAVGQYEPSLKIDVDMDIPQAQSLNENAVAVIIGNRNYRHKDVFRVDYAHRDANVVKDYMERMFGYLPGNIIFLTDATQGDFMSIFGDVTNYQGRLYNIIKSGQSDVFVYYSGHGAPDPEGKKSYFLPVDCDPSLVRLNGYSLDVFYNNLSKLPARSVTVVIDACFSGITEQGMLLKQISPVFIEVEDPVLASDKMAVFSSSTGKQVSTWYPEKKHGLFTYYFLKGLRGDADLDKNNSITAKELTDFANENVPYMARRLRNREQTPTFSGGKDDVIIRKY